MPTTKIPDPHALDWRQPDIALAQRHGCSRAYINTLRNRLGKGPPTLRGAVGRNKKPFIPFAKRVIAAVEQGRIKDAQQYIKEHKKP